MAQPLFPRPLQSKYRTCVIYCGFVLSINLLIVEIQATPDAIYTAKEVKPGAGAISPAQEDRQIRQLEPGKPIERELAADQPHSYQMTLAAGQYVKLLVDQRGIDVVVKLFGPDGKQLIEANSERRQQGQETVSWVAEEAGSYRLDVLAKQKDAAAGRYEIQMVELHVATEDDHALHEAWRLSAAIVRLYRASKYDQARRLGEHALEIRERVLGPEHPDVVPSLYDLANLCWIKGDYAKAESFYQRALTISEKALRPAHPDVSDSLNNLANLHFIKGEYAKAEQFYQHILTIGEKALGLEHPEVARYLNSLATLYHVRGSYAKAEQLYQRALSIGEKAQGPDHPDVAYSLTNLGTIYRERGNYVKAEQFLQRALIIRQKVLKPEHPRVAVLLTDLANLYTDSGDYAKAEPLYQRALPIMEKSLGTEHPSVAASLFGLALFYYRKSDYARAEPLYRRALTSWEKIFGAEHPKVAASLNNLAMLYAAKGDIAQAVAFLSRASAIDERNFAHNLAAGSERQKLAYLSLFAQGTDFTLSLQSRTARNDPRALDLAFTTLLRRKGRGLDAMTNIIATLRRHATPEDQKLFDELADARSRLAALTFKGAEVANPNIYRTLVGPLEDEVEKLESKLSSRSAEFRAQSQPVTLAAVQAALSAGSALVEIAFFTPQEPRTKKSKPPRYLAYLLTAQGQPKWVDLGEAAPIDRAVDAWRKALRNPNRTAVKRLARAVDEKVMRPVRSLLDQMPGKMRRLLIAPDGSLNLIPFAALVDERNRYLVERYSISYLSSGRDLLRLQSSETSKNPPLVVANPLFGSVEAVAKRADQNSANSPAGDQADNQGPAQNNPREVFFQALPGTRREALAIKALLPEASLLLREEATEAAVKQAHAPSILHIATHGFFLDDQEPPPPDTRGFSTDGRLRISDPRIMKWVAKIENPLLRSGLALAGVNQHRGGDDDGLLTALEAASLDLWGTKLVVLSACDTGVGKVKNGEGVYGLRRALVLAGSQTQVISLWPVSDRETRGLMAGYYRRLQKGEGRGEALRQIQLEMLKDTKLRHPYYWASFIQAGEWANLDGKR
jgi:CHAT domain-containing protein/Tfp pilus assembly protein PilF